MNFKKEIDEITKQAITELDKVKLNQRTNKDRLKAIGNIYFLYSNGEMKYIGQRQAKGIKTRLNQHLFGKSFSVNKHNVQNGTINLFFCIIVKKIMESTTITCTHCGQMFSKSMTLLPSANGSTLAHHSPSGCRKSTRIHYVNGKITKTTKA